VIDPRCQLLADEIHEAIWRVCRDDANAPLSIIVNATVSILAHYIVSAVPPEDRDQSVPLLTAAFREALAQHGAIHDYPWAHDLDGTKH
jgi:hypothetical protein